ncbi:transposase component [Acinetobacter baumannii]|nr:transposase component [Acinetobacter baumannii]
MNTLPDLSQLTHEQLLEFTRQLAMQHQSLAQSNQELEKSNQQLDAKVQHLEVTNQQLDSKVQHLSILNQKYEHELALFKQHKFGSKNEHLTAKQIHLWDEAVEEDIAAVDLELERLNADKTDAVDHCQIIYTPSVLSMNLHQPNALVAANSVVSAKMSVKNCISDRHSSIRNSMCVVNGSVISVTP